MRLLTGPLANVTPTGPLPAPAGTTAEIWVVDRLLKVVAGTPPNVTPVTPTRPVPSIITVMPGAPPAGVTPVMSAGGLLTVSGGVTLTPLLAGASGGHPSTVRSPSKLPTAASTNDRTRLLATESVLCV